MQDGPWGGLGGASGLLGQYESPLQPQRRSSFIESAWLGQMAAHMGAWSTAAAACFGAPIAGFMFRRINELVEWKEGSVFEEPIDWLRIKVAKWLRKER